MKAVDLDIYMKHAELWGKNEFAMLLFTHNTNKEIDNIDFFKDLIFDAVSAGLLTPVFANNDNDLDPRVRDYKFRKADLISWAKKMNFRLPLYLEPDVEHLLTKMKLESLWSLEDIAKVFAVSGNKITDPKFYTHLLYDALQANELSTTPERWQLSDYKHLGPKFKRETILNWGKGKQLKLHSDLVVKIDNISNEEEIVFGEDAIADKAHKTLSSRSKKTYLTILTALEEVLGNVEYASWKVKLCNNLVGKKPKNGSSDEEKYYLLRIFILVNILTTYLPDELELEQTAVFKNQSDLIAYMVDAFSGHQNLSKHTLELRFATANEYFKNNFATPEYLSHEESATQDA